MVANERAFVKRKSFGALLKSEAKVDEEKIEKYLFGECGSEEKDSVEVEEEEEADEDFEISMRRISTRKKSINKKNQRLVQPMVKKARTTGRIRHSVPNDWGTNVIDLTGSCSESSDSNHSTNSSLISSSQSSPISTLSDARSTRNTMREDNDDTSGKVDVISSLPTDILVHLLSFVKTKTAARTSLLSKRWKHVWTYIPDVNFDEKSKGIEVSRYGYWINKALTVNRAPYLNTFRVHLPLYGLSEGDIDEWVKSALRKKVHNLELNMSTSKGVPLNDYCTISSFPLNRPPWATHYPHTTQYDHASLKSLHLEALIVHRDVVKSVLSNCLNLESLRLRGCCILYSLTDIMGNFTMYPKKEIVVSSLKLKHLELSCCQDTESFQICAPQLTSFVLFARHKVKVEYSSSPSLVNITFGGQYCYDIFQNLHIFDDFSNRIQKLSLCWDMFCSAPSGFPSLPKVKQLEFAVVDPGDGDDNLLALISFIQACPLLQNFKLKLLSRLEPGLPMSAPRAVQINAIRGHRNLEVLELEGYSGSASATEFALCLTHHAPTLNKIIFHPRCPQSMWVRHMVSYDESPDKVDLVRTQAKLLAKRIQGGVHVVIL